MTDYERGFEGLPQPPELKEADFVETDAHQAVFLESGQVYYGKLDILDDVYVLRGIYYSRSDLGNSSLVKLGNEIHGPEDQMVIPRQGDMSFWENLRADGQVSVAIHNFEQTELTPSQYEPLPKDEKDLVKPSQYQGICLTSGQWYFGGLWVLNETYVLQGTYYLEKRPTAEDPENTVLTKLGNEIHGPKDKLFIPKKGNVAYWENLRDDSQITKSIREYKEKNGLL